MNINFKSPAFLLICLYFIVPRVSLVLLYFFLPGFSEVMGDPVLYGFAALLTPTTCMVFCLTKLFWAWNLISAGVLLLTLAFDFAYVIPRG